MPSIQTLAPDGERTILLERRFAYSYGIVEMLATFDENGILLIEAHAGDESRIIPITTREGQDRLQHFLAQEMGQP